jgi:hypothetical protein
MAELDVDTSLTLLTRHQRDAQNTTRRDSATGACRGLALFHVIPDSGFTQGI